MKKIITSRIDKHWLHLEHSIKHLHSSLSWDKETYNYSMAIETAKYMLNLFAILDEYQKMLLEIED